MFRLDPAARLLSKSRMSRFPSSGYYNERRPLGFLTHFFSQIDQANHMKPCIYENLRDLTPLIFPATDERNQRGQGDLIETNRPDPFIFLLMQVAKYRRLG